jgi:hypothetical protein
LLGGAAEERVSKHGEGVWCNRQRRSQRASCERALGGSLTAHMQPNPQVKSLGCGVLWLSTVARQ